MISRLCRLSEKVTTSGESLLPVQEQLLIEGRIALQMLCGNVALNALENIRCRREAVGAAPGKILVPPLGLNAENKWAPCLWAVTAGVATSTS